MCSLRQRIYAVVELRPSTPGDIEKILGLAPGVVSVALPGMDAAGLILFEDDAAEGEVGILHPFAATALIPAAIAAECARLVDAFEMQMPLPDGPQKTVL